MKLDFEKIRKEKVKLHITEHIICWYYLKVILNF